MKNTVKSLHPSGLGDGGGRVVGCVATWLDGGHGGGGGRANALKFITRQWQGHAAGHRALGRHWVGGGGGIENIAPAMLNTFS